MAYNHSRVPMVDGPRLASNTATERIQPSHGHATIKETPLEQFGAVGVISTITRGPTGIGAVYSFAEPVGNRWHEVEGPVPLVSRAAGA